MWKFNSMVLNNGSLKKLNRKIKKYLETSENESTNRPKHQGYNKSSFKNEFYSNIILASEISNKQPTPTPKTPRKR